MILHHIVYVYVYIYIYIYIFPALVSTKQGEESERVRKDSSMLPGVLEGQALPMVIVNVAQCIRGPSSTNDLLERISQPDSSRINR